MYKLIIFLVLFKFSIASDAASNIRYYFYHGVSLDIYDVTNLATIVNNPDFDASKPTTFYIYGTLESILAPTVANVKLAYLMNGKQNFIVVGNLNPLNHVFTNAPTIADRFSTNMYEFLETGYDVNKVTFVSFSLGSKAIAPLTSRLLKTKSSNRYNLPKLIALDPGIIETSEMYLVGNVKLNTNDFGFVMVIHTDCNTWGTKDKLGHVDFWVNGGCNQPMCFTNTMRSFCNHLMAPTYWAEAVRNDRHTAFESKKCTSWNLFLANGCYFQPVAYIGLYTPTTTTGNYYGRTTLLPPYSST